MSRVDHTDERGAVRSTRYSYDDWNNQVSSVSEGDYDGTVVPNDRDGVKNDLAYRAGAHIFNLPKVVRVRAGGSGQGPLIALTEISYDEGDLLAIPGAVARNEG